MSEPIQRSWVVYLPGALPGYTQLHERGNHFSTRRLKLKHQDDVAFFLRARHIPQLACVRLHYHHTRSNRRFDKSNLAAGAMKIIEDAMVELKIIKDDGWNFVESFSHAFEIGARDGVTLTITEVIS